MPHETYPAGVFSHHASRLRTTESLVGVWGAYMGVAFAGNPGGDGGAPSQPDPTDGGDTGSGSDPDASAATTRRPCKQGTALDYPATVSSNIAAYSGITFWAAVAPDSEARTIRVQLNDSNTDPRGRSNAGAPNSDTNCYNGFGTSVT